MKIVINASVKGLEQCVDALGEPDIATMLDSYLLEWMTKALSDLITALSRHHYMASTFKKVSWAASKAFGIAPMDLPFQIETSHKIESDVVSIVIKVTSYEQYLINLFGSEEALKQKLAEREENFREMIIEMGGSIED
jgi:hypothetical protein